MHVASIISTKGGVGKTTTTANLGGFIADAGLRVLLVDLDKQPTLSSFFPLAWKAPAGIYELLAFNEQDCHRLISKTTVAGLDVIVSNDSHGLLDNLLLHAADGRLRLRNLLPVFQPHYDLMLIDTQGARSVMLEMAILASDLAISPVTPEILAARELSRGTIQLIEDIAPFRHLGIIPPPLRLLVNRTPAVSTTAAQIQQALRQVFKQHPYAQMLDTSIPTVEAYLKAAALGVPVHRLEPRRPSGRKAPAALDTQRRLAQELFPMWAEAFQNIGTRMTSASVQAGESHV